MKACHERVDISQQSRVLSGYFGMYKVGAVVVARWYFPHIFKYVDEFIKFCDVCQDVNTYNCKEETKLHIPV